MEYVPKKRMKDMSARSGMNWQEFPSKRPPYFRHSFLLSSDQSSSVRLRGLYLETKHRRERVRAFLVGQRVLPHSPQAALPAPQGAPALLPHGTQQQNEAPGDRVRNEQ